MSSLVFDIESTKLLEGSLPSGVEKVHCVVTQDVNTRLQAAYHDDQGLAKTSSLANGLTNLRDATLIAGHNIVGFDLPVLESLKDWKEDKGQIIIDTLCLSRLMFPERHHHSLEAWAKL